MTPWSTLSMPARMTSAVLVAAARLSAMTPVVNASMIDADLGQPEIEEEQLHDERRVAEDVEVGDRQPAHRRDRRAPRRREGEAEQQAEHDSEKRDEDGDLQPVEEACRTVQKPGRRRASPLRFPTRGGPGIAIDCTRVQCVNGRGARYGRDRQWTRIGGSGDLRDMRRIRWPASAPPRLRERTGSSSAAIFSREARRPAAA